MLKHDKNNDSLIINNDLRICIENFLEEPNGDGLYLFGPSGCGKTSAINKIANEKNFEVIQITCNSRFQISDLIGYQTIIDDKLQFIYGPLAKAMKYGAIIIINEIDLADPGELAGLNDILENRKIIIIQNNCEVIFPHKNFRFVVTANTKGNGANDNFAGTQILNTAFLDRFRFFECKYLSHDDECKVLNSAVPSLPQNYVDGFVRVANEIRSSNSNFVSDHVYMSVPMSTRTLVRWAKISDSYMKIDMPKPVHEALKESFTFRLSDEESTYIHRMTQDILPNID